MAKLRENRWVRRTATLVAATVSATVVVVLSAVRPALADSGSWWHNLTHNLKIPHEALHKSNLL